MTRTIKVTIGDEEVEVPRLNFDALYASWDKINKLDETIETMERAKLIIAIMAAALAGSRPDLTEAVIRERLIGVQFIGLMNGFWELMEVSGMRLVGETKPAASKSSARSASKN